MSDFGLGLIIVIAALAIMIFVNKVQNMNEDIKKIQVELCIIEARLERIAERLERMDTK